jgi:branched-chain amino acid transport system substrate-binding protein
VRRVIPVLLVLGLLLHPGIACSDSPQPPIKIGAIFCLTGEIASGCNAIREGAEVALDLVNQSGGVRGRPLRLEIQDSHYSPRDSHTLAQRFAGDPSVLGVLITGIVETKAAAAPLEKAHMPYVTLWDSAPEIEALGTSSFGIGPWLPASYELASEFAFSHLQRKRAAVIATTAEWSIGVSKGFVEHFKGLGGEIVSYEEVLPSDADFRSVLARALTEKPDLIYAPVTSHLIPFFKQLRQLGYAGPVITSDNLTDELVAQGGGVFEGVFQTMVGEPENPEAERLKVLYQKKFGRAPKMLAFHGWGYDGVRLMAEALAHSDLTRESLREALLAIRSFPGAGGAITFSAEGSWRMPLAVFEVRQGALHPVRSPT